MNRVTRTAVALAAVVVMSGTLAACQNARIGQRCRGNGFAQTSSQILQCKAGRWRFLMTKAQYVQLIIALRNRSTTTTPPTTAPPTTAAPTTTVPAAPSAYDIGPGYEHTCAVIAGTVKCVGRNQYGQLGNGTTTDSTTWVSTGITDATTVSNANMSCAIRADGTLWCWGFGGSGLGNGSTTDSTIPVQVTGITTATQVAVGPQGACVVLADQTARCWGIPTLRGDGIPMSTWTPVTVALSAVKSLDVGTNHACAVKIDATVWCWGDNTSGQLGDGTTTLSHLPTQVSGVTGAVDISTGGATSCAVMDTGQAMCWGRDDDYQLGDGDASTTASLVPKTVVGLSDAVEVDMSFYSTCARRSTGAVACWGRGSLLGAGTVTDSSSPVAVDGITTASALGSYGASNCALLADHSARCWGSNFYGQLGTGSTDSALTPQVVAGMP